MEKERHFNPKTGKEYFLDEYEQDISIIIKYELEMVDAISKGHKASHDDQFEVYRIELIRLRNKWNMARQKIENEL